MCIGARTRAGKSNCSYLATDAQRVSVRALDFPVQAADLVPHQPSGDATLLSCWNNPAMNFCPLAA